ncbi:insulinase family protein [Streptomyces sp. NPDC000877]|uniref:insulinase family protein n=1 Tax=unclassified Streptomyces TaxID=2593676 RepID=UPI0033241B19
MTAVLTRPDAPLAWLRVRLRVEADAAGRVALGRVLAEALPTAPAGGTPLHRRLALLGAVASVEADGHGVVAHVAAEPGRFAETVEAVTSALHAPLPAGLLAEARAASAAAWRWERDDSEATADLLADLALHTPPSQWSGLHDALLAAMADRTPSLSRPASAGTLSAAYVGPHHGAALLHGLSSRGAEPAPDTSPVSRGHWDLDVVSDGSALIRLGWRAPRRDHEDFAALAVAARVVGGHHHAWLTREFRTERRWAYSPWALLRSGPGHGLWQVSLRVPHGHVEEAAARVRALVRSCRPTEAEHHAAVAHARTEILRLWSAGETAVSLLGYWQDLGLDPHEERTRWLTALSATTRDTVADAASRWLDTEPHITAVLG